MQETSQKQPVFTMNRSYSFKARFLPSGGGCLIFLGNAGGISLLVLLLVLSGNGSEDRVIPKIANQKSLRLFQLIHLK